MLMPAVRVQTMGAHVRSRRKTDRARRGGVIHTFDPLGEVAAGCANTDFLWRFALGSGRRNPDPDPSREKLT